MTLRLRSAIGWTLGGNVAVMTAHWLLLVVVGRLGGVEQLGTFALALALAGPVVLFAHLGMRQLHVAGLCTQVPLGTFMGLRIVLLLVSGALLAGFAFLTKADPWFALLVALTMLVKLLMGISDLLSAVMQRHERLDLASASTAIATAAGALAFAAVFAVTLDLVMATAAQVVAWLVALPLFQIRRLARLAADELRSCRTLAGKRDDLRALALAGFPLAASGMLVSLTSNLPRYALEAYWDTAALGLFAACAYFLTAGSKVVQAVNQALLRRTAVAFETKQRQRYRRLLGTGLALSTGLGLCAIVGALLLGGTILEIAYGADFAAGKPTLVWIMVAGALAWLTTPLGTALVVQRRLWAQPLITGTTMAVVGIASLFLVPLYGPSGAALTLCLGYGLRFLIMAALVGWSNGRTGAMASAPAPALSDA